MATGTTTEYLYPEAANQLQDTAAGYVQNMPQFATDVYNNWYNQPLSTGTTPWQQQAWSAAMAQPSQQWQAPLQQASAMYSQGAQFDPAKLQQHLNPYQQGANQATIDQYNRNFTENTLPGVNSTFAGAGQFGSTRNAEFTNRAMRDSQLALGEVLAKQNAANYAQANQNYLDWNKQGQSAASGLASVAGAGAALDQTNLTNMLTAANAQQQQEQQILDRAYQDYLKRQEFPLNFMGGLSTAASNIGRMQEPNVNVPVAQPDNLAQIIAALKGVNQGLSDPNLQALIDSLLGTSGGA